MRLTVLVLILVVQIAQIPFPTKLLPSAIGLLVGYLYRSDFLQLKSWRISPRCAVPAAPTSARTHACGLVLAPALVLVQDRELRADVDRPAPG